MKRFYTLIIAALCGLTALATTHSLEFNLHGGAVTYLVPVEVTTIFGPQGGLGIGYSYRSIVDRYNTTELGLYVGLDASYASMGLRKSINDRFTRYDYMNREMVYTLDYEAREMNRQWQVMVPLMLDLKAGGFRFRVGPQFQMILKRDYTQDIAGEGIDVYYPAYNLHINDAPKLGTLTEADRHRQGAAILPRWNVLVGAEIGYTLMLENKYGMDLGSLSFLLYANYGVWSSYQNTPGQSLIDIAPISNPNHEQADVTISTLTQCYAERMNYLDFGLRISYAISWYERQSPGMHHQKRYHKGCNCWK